MRPPEHWHLRRQRRSRVPWLLLLAALGVVAGGFLLRSQLSGSEEPANEASVPVSAVASNDECGQPECGRPLVAECLGSDCATPAPAVQPTATAALSAFNDFLVPSLQPPPEITGAAAAVLEASCGALLYGSHADERFAPASLTKIATALVAAERSDFAEVADVKVNSALLVASTGSSVMGLEPGQRLTVRDLMHGLLMASGNDAAIAIAEHVGGTVPAFVSLMNGRVQALGLQNTRFANPHGLDEDGLYSSAYDMAVLGRELLARPELAGIVETVTYQPAWNGPPVWNGNRLIYEYPGAIGVKTGYTADAGQTIVAAARRDGRTVVVSVMGAWDRYADAVALFDWAFANTESPCAG